MGSQAEVTVFCWIFNLSHRIPKYVIFVHKIRERTTLTYRNAPFSLIHLCLENFGLKL